MVVSSKVRVAHRPVARDNVHFSLYASIIQEGDDSIFILTSSVGHHRISLPLVTLRVNIVRRGIGCLEFTVKPISKLHTDLALVVEGAGSFELVEVFVSLERMVIQVLVVIEGEPTVGVAF